MKFLWYFMLILFLSCNSSSTEQKTKIEVEKDFTFQGISIFKKGLTLEQTTKELKDQKIHFSVIQKNNDELGIFGLPFLCCNEKSIIYVPYYTIGSLRLTDLFILFEKNRIATIYCELVSDGYTWNDGISEFKKYFRKKYGKGIITEKDSAVTYRSLIQINTEIYHNQSDSIIMLFKNHIEIDTVNVYDFHPKINHEVININKAKESFRKKYLHSEIKTTRGKKNKKGEVLPEDFIPAGRESMICCPDYKYALKTAYYSFIMTFPNSMEECCKNSERQIHTTDSLYKANQEKNILDKL